MTVPITSRVSGILVSMLVVLAACNGGRAATSVPAAEGQASGGEAAECVLPLAQWCTAEHACPGFDAALATARARLARGEVRSLVTGTCGPYRYLTAQEGMGASTDYYDAQGALAATYGMGDTPARCGGRTFGGWYGARPRCTQQPTETLASAPAP